jgi:hypothetical protein
MNLNYVVAHYRGLQALRRVGPPIRHRVESSTAAPLGANGRGQREYGSTIKSKTNDTMIIRDERV